jgi:hypothetical protein
MTVTQPTSALSLQDGSISYDEDLDRKGFTLKDDYGLQTITAPQEVNLDDPDTDIDPNDVTKKELAGWYGYGFAAEAYG